MHSPVTCYKGKEMGAAVDEGQLARGEGAGEGRRASRRVFVGLLQQASLQADPAQVPGSSLWVGTTR